MAEPKKKKIVSASTGEEVQAGAKKKNIKQAKPVGNSMPYRIGAFALWAVALVLEFIAIFILFGKITWTFLPQLTLIIIALVLDLACVIIGAQLWKKANHIKPASEKNKFLFWLWNNMGVIACAVAFIPFVILALTNKNADKKTKAIATVVAVIALLIGGVASYDYNPVSEEQQQAAIAAIDDIVFWSPFGKVYHTHEDCQALHQSETLKRGDVEQAIAANRTRLCSFCAKRDDITGVVTDDKDVDAVEADNTSEDENTEE